MLFTLWFWVQLAAVHSVLVCTQMKSEWPSQAEECLQLHMCPNLSKVKHMNDKQSNYQLYWLQGYIPLLWHSLRKEKGALNKPSGMWTNEGSIRIISNTVWSEYSKDKTHPTFFLPPLDFHWSSQIWTICNKFISIYFSIANNPSMMIHNLIGKRYGTSLFGICLKFCPHCFNSFWFRSMS